MPRKLETELVSISCPELRRAGLFVEGRSKLLRWSSGASVMVRGGVDTLEFDGAVIPLFYTPCRLGGQRPWMLCQVCDRRSGRLFLDQALWQCRHCADIRYASPLVMTERRAHLRIARIDERVTWARRPWQARVLLAKRAKLEAKLKAMK